MDLLRILIGKINGVIFLTESYFLEFVAVFDYLKSNKQVYKKPSICAFYQCYKQPKSVIATLASFRKIYPTSSIHLFCDVGDDMSHIASYFNCKYEYISTKTGNGTTLYFLTKAQVIIYLKRLLITAQNSTEDFMMILEDDTRVYREIKTIKYDWNAIKANHHYSGRKLTSLLRARNSSIPSYIGNMYFAGCGGAMMNRAFFVENFSDIPKVENVIDLLSPYIQKQWEGALPQDAILTALVLYFGGSVGLYPGFTEVRYKRYRWKPFLGPFDIVHDDKSLYNLPLSEEESKIFYGK